MSAQIFYLAEWVKDVLVPPEGEEFDPYRDTVYSSSKHATFDSAKRKAQRMEAGWGYATVRTFSVSRGIERETARESVL
jgi:hypothetical protein